MKRLILCIITAVLMISICSCAPAVSESEMETTLAEFKEALVLYDREAMTEYLTEFPDNTGYVYIDDIFNDAEYINLYRLLYKDISYEIKEYSANHMVVVFSMPDIQALYTEVSTWVLTLALSDEELFAKLEESEENGVVLTREMMLAIAEKGEDIDRMEQEYTLTFEKEKGKTVIRCDDELRALITGNFFLSKNMTTDEIEEQPE